MALTARGTALPAGAQSALRGEGGS
jgi:hypothetical protein